MAKVKADWLKEAKVLGLDVTEKNTVAEIQEAIKKAPTDSKSEEAVATKTKPTTKPTAKAGKRSKKGLEEAEAKAQKEARKRGEVDDKSPADTAKKGPAPTTRTTLERKGKKYRKAAEVIDKIKNYPINDAMELVVKTSTANFDATVELHIRLNVDPKQSDQNIRDVVSLPNGTGKTLRVAVFAPADQHKKALESGADLVGEDDILKQLDKEQIDFDVLIATPQVMSRLGKYAKLLGPRGLMPNPKSGTVTGNVASAVKAAKGGRVEFRIDAQGIIHCPVGKVSFGSSKLVENAQALIGAVMSSKPSSIKGPFVNSIYATSTMGPSVRVES